MYAKRFVGYADPTSEHKRMAFGFGGDPQGYMKILSGALVGAAGSLAMWFNDILNGEAKFSFSNFFMLVFIGTIIGILAVMVAPMFHVDDQYVVVFASACAAAHKYILRSMAWFLDKWTSSKAP